MVRVLFCLGIAMGSCSEMRAQDVLPPMSVNFELLTETAFPEKDVVSSSTESLTVMVHSTYVNGAPAHLEVGNGGMVRGGYVRGFSKTSGEILIADGFQSLKAYRGDGSQYFQGIMDDKSTTSTGVLDGRFTDIQTEPEALMNTVYYSPSMYVKLLDGAKKESAKLAQTPTGLWQDKAVDPKTTIKFSQDGSRLELCRLKNKVQTDEKTFGDFKKIGDIELPQSVVVSRFNADNALLEAKRYTLKYDTVISREEIKERLARIGAELEK